MSVVWAHERAGGRGGRESLTPARTWATRNYTRHFQVYTSDQNDGPQTISASGALPSLLDLYIAGNDVDLGAVCSNISYNQPNNNQPKIWEVVCEYEGADNPLTRPHLIRTGFATRERIVWQDVYQGPRGNAVPIVNSAGVYFDPPVTINENQPLVSIERNEVITIDPVALDLAYGNTTNADFFFGAAPNTVLCLGITGGDAFEGGIWYWNMHYEFCYRSDGWVRYLLDQGLMWWDATIPAGGTKPNGYTDATDSKGNVTTEPQALDGKGKLLATTLGRLPGPNDFIFLPYNVFVSVPFAPLALP
jgi:hypothetical protein